MNGTQDLAASFDSLKPGQRVRVAFSSCMAGAGTVEFLVGRRTHSKKYNVRSVSLKPGDGSKARGCKVVLYKRASGAVSMALGNMGVMLESFVVV